MPRTVTDSLNSPVSIPSSWGTEMTVVRLCARPTLMPVHQERLAHLVTTEVDWERLAERAAFHGVLGMVYHHLAGRVPDRVPAPVLQSMAHTSRRIQEKNLLAIQALTRVAAEFNDADVPLLTFKGPSLAHEYYGNVAFRQFGDIDVLVQRAHLDRAQAILEADGYRRTHVHSDAELARHYRDQLGVEFRHPQTGVTIELHWALLNRTFSFRLAPEDLWARAQTAALGGETIRTLAPDDLVLYLCAHGTKHHWSRLQCVCDVAQVLDHHPDLDWPSLQKTAQRIGSHRTLLLGAHLTERWLGRSLPLSVSTAMNEVPVIGRLATEIEDRWLGTAEGLHPPADSTTLWFFLRTRERMRDNGPMIAHYLRLLIAPTTNDREALPVTLPEGLNALYYAVRPLRLLASGGWRLARRAAHVLKSWGDTVSTRSRALLRRAGRLRRRIRERSWAERREMAVAFVAASVVAGLLHTCSFRRVLQLLDRWGASRSSEGMDDSEERRLLRAVESVTRRLLPRRPCLTQALTARLLLARRGARPTTLQIGVARGTDEALGAHAWLERNGAVLIGGTAAPQSYTPLTDSSRFPERATAPQWSRPAPSEQ
jgi:hypothetical protein